MRYIISLNSNWFQNAQPFKVGRLEKMSILVAKRTFFSILQLWWVAIFKPVGVQRYNIPQIKDLIMFELYFEAQRNGSSLIFCCGPLKKAILLHRRPSVLFDFLLAVLACSLKLHNWKNTNQNIDLKALLTFWLKFIFGLLTNLSKYLNSN